MKSGRGHVTIIKKLGLRRLGLPPVTRRRYRVTDRVIGCRQGALRIPRRLCDRKPDDPPKLGASFAWSLEYDNYSRTISSGRQSPFDFDTTRCVTSLNQNAPGGAPNVKVWRTISFLSNFYVCRIHAWGHAFNTVEAVYMYRKCVFYDDTETPEKMLATRTGLQAKYLSKTIREKEHLRAQWNKQTSCNGRVGCD